MPTISIPHQVTQSDNRRRVVMHSSMPSTVVDSVLQNDLLLAPNASKVLTGSSLLYLNILNPVRITLTVGMQSLPATDVAKGVMIIPFGCTATVLNPSTEDTARIIFIGDIT